MHRTLLALMLVALTVRGTSAQIVVTDPAVTLRNSVTAVLKEYLLNVQQDQHRKLRRMARRLSVFTNLDKYAVLDPPRWRTRRPDEFLFDGEYNAALAFGAVTCRALLIEDLAAVTNAAASRRQVIAVAKRAIEARFPWAAAKHYSYDAFLESDGMWGVYVPHPHEPGVLYFGGGDPNAEVRDRDGKVLKVYLAR